MFNYEEKYPMSWYPICLTKEVEKDRPLSVQVFGRSWIVFNVKNDQYSIVSGTCKHMGTDLSKGKVVNGQLRCPFHHWKYDSGGKCAAIPNWDRPIPQKAKLDHMPTKNVAGIIYGFLSKEEGFDFPFFKSDEMLSYSSTTTMVLDTPYQALLFNSLDTSHLECIHNREIVTPISFSGQEAHHLHAEFTMRVLVRKSYDFIVHFLGKGEMEVILDCYGGNHLIISNRRTNDLIVITSHPINRYKSRIFLQAVRRGKKSFPMNLLMKLRLKIVESLGVAFLQPDIDIVERMRPEQSILLPELDDGVKKFWLYYKNLKLDEDFLEEASNFTR